MAYYLTICDTFYFSKNLAVPKFIYLEKNYFSIFLAPTPLSVPCFTHHATENKRILTCTAQSSFNLWDRGKLFFIQLFDVRFKRGNLHRVFLVY